jgi:hypothetical protein
VRAAVGAALVSLGGGAPALGQTPPPAPPLPSTPDRVYRSVSSPPRTTVPDEVRGDAEGQYFFLHDDNYFALRFNEGSPPLVKFQVSVRFEMFRWGQDNKYALNFAYTQTSYWDLFNGDASNPVIESNYRPELFFSFRPGAGHQRHRELQLGYLHDSNGLGDFATVKQAASSLGWNTAFAQGRWGFSRDGAREPWFYPSVGARFWIPFAYSDGLQKQLGYGQVFFEVDLSIPDHLRLGRLSNRVTLRMHNVEDDLMYPLAVVLTDGRVRAWAYVQFFYGEAESLLTAGQTVTHAYAGVAFQ